MMMMMMMRKLYAVVELVVVLGSATYFWDRSINLKVIIFL